MAEFGGVNAHAHADLLRQAMLQNVIRTTNSMTQKKQKKKNGVEEETTVAKNN
ncbi:hypothetical protein MGYG_01252 [Nannizzia gypsea CBS 118893]|uniref:Uncharacterized protein n=1 Tax=Arthroderma gypseum (strain ATCC MYA-4604 / CBS 118893) TaxID=535722 RepID=E5QZR6_ARTGP|nr:hypothetical protein MGYG_01252 [Nannizzia gypsea CBS 118893]EFQ98217.1 hypothetical protein MGYG_01252 [Nannizzia gypsea CBS 118893]